MATRQQQQSTQQPASCRQYLIWKGKQGKTVEKRYLICTSDLQSVKCVTIINSRQRLLIFTYIYIINVCNLPPNCSGPPKTDSTSLILIAVFTGKCMNLQVENLSTKKSWMPEIFNEHLYSWHSPLMSTACHYSTYPPSMRVLPCFSMRDAFRWKAKATHPSNDHFSETSLVIFTQAPRHR